MTPTLSGILILDKPPGLTSARAVAIVKHLLSRKYKIGHAGTLDPFATGVLLLLVGKATKQSESLMGQEKEYLATVKLGATTPTDDPDSLATIVDGATDPGSERIDEAIKPFIGLIQQTPPPFSALKIGGKSAYKRVRAGETVHLAPRPVHVYEIENLGYDWPLLQLRIRCGRGTYIRSIARDLGVALNTGAHLTELRRTRIGSHVIDQSVTLDQLRAEGVERHLIQTPPIP